MRRSPQRRTALTGNSGATSVTSVADGNSEWKRSLNFSEIGFLREEGHTRMNMRGVKYHFVVPLKARYNAHDWDYVLHLLRETLASVQRQTSADFRVCVACQDDPGLGALGDDRLQWLRFQGSPPERGDGKGGDADKKAKIAAIGCAMREACLEETYVTYLDADDLISSTLVKTVLERDNKAGFIFRSGYVLDLARNILSLMEDRFDRDCGTSSSCYMTYADFPTGLSDYKSYFVNMARHAYSRELAEMRGLVLEDFPYPAALYRINHGDSLERLKHGLKRGRGRPVEADEAARVLEEHFGWHAGAALVRSGDSHGLNGRMQSAE